MSDVATYEFLLPLYGDPGLGRRAIDSVLRQTYRDFQLTIVDDAFPDFPLAEHVRRLDDARVRYVQNNAVLGAGGNFRRTLSLATADHLTFMGADDVLLPMYLERMNEVLAEHPDVDVVQPGVRVIDENGVESNRLVDRAKRRLGPRPDAQPVILAGQSLAISLLRGNWTYFPSLLWRRSSIATVGFRHYDVVQDLGLLLDVVAGGGSMLIDPRVTFEYRRHAASLSAALATTGMRFDEERAYFRTAASELDRLGWRRAARQARLRPFSRLHAATLIPGALRSSDLAASRRLLRHAFLS